MIHNEKCVVTLQPGHGTTMFVALVPDEDAFTVQTTEKAAAFTVHKADAERWLRIVSEYRGMQRELRYLLASGEGLIPPPSAGDGGTETTP